VVAKKAQFQRRLPIGAEVMEQGTHFRVWAPSCKKVAVILEDKLKGESQIFPLKPEKQGYFSNFIEGIKEGTPYWFRLDQAPKYYPDPASRFQPEGPYGPSCVIDPKKYTWTDRKWPGVTFENRIIYELHIGTFTPEGTFQSAKAHLSELAFLGINLIELMPLNDFPGHFNWGYDGVNLFAPSRVYGQPHDLHEFINKAHELGIGVILDVVYNHFGPEANFISHFSDRYFVERETEWGQAINFDCPDVRLFYLSNARYWIDEYHFDGLRIDATQAISSSTPTHILKELAIETKRAGKERQTIVIGENEPQRSIIVRPIERGGYGFDALWNDDFHHSATVRLTGHREAYYTDYIGSPQEFLSCLKYGFLYQGQYYKWQKQTRGTPSLDIPPSSFIIFLQNHDQIANSGKGDRIHQLTDPSNLRAMTCLLLLSPCTPMLFQGQEFAASSPFFYFADHSDDLAKKVDHGRHEFLAQFPRLATREMQSHLPNPTDPLTFLHSKLNFRDRTRHQEIYLLHRDLIRLRRRDPVFSSKIKMRVDGTVYNSDAFSLRYFGQEGMDRLLLFNFGMDFTLDPCNDPLLAAPDDFQWTLLWSSEWRKYGGEGSFPVNFNKLCALPGRSALVFKLRSKRVLK
jgi:maltooligosyltrehalose trehalohydrolase